MCLSGVSMKTMLLIVVEKFASKPKSLWFFSRHKVKSLKDFLRPSFQIYWKFYRKFYWKFYWKFYRKFYWKFYTEENTTKNENSKIFGKIFSKIFSKISGKISGKISSKFGNWASKSPLKGFYLVFGKKSETFWFGSKFLNNY